MLLFPLSELPELAKGKGNKLIGIPGSRVASREEFVTQVAVIPAGQPVTLHAGKRKLTLKPSDLDLYRGERGRRVPSCRVVCNGSTRSSWRVSILTMIVTVFNARCPGFRCRAFYLLVMTRIIG